MGEARRVNRGRQAAPDNRRALIAAAAEVFGEQGIDAPLSAVAKRAGVGQGSLYRHFPDRVELALAAFENNVADLEELAAAPGTTLEDLLLRITEQTIASVAFVDIVLPGVADPRLDALTARMRAALTDPLRRARAAGSIGRATRTDDLMLAIGLVAALVARSPAGERRATADAAWALLHHGLHP